MEDQMNYYCFSREQWKQFYRNNQHQVPLTAANLHEIEAFNDRISLDDVRDIYMPFAHLLQAKYEHYLSWRETESVFLHRQNRQSPFIIGVSGSVAVGKTTTARLLEILFKYLYPDRRTQLITTDGFLYPNAELKKMQLMERKGFPESYDMTRLIQFLNDVKSGKPLAKAPVYSHQTYDIVPNRFDVITHPDILIIEGINVLQLPSNQAIYISDFTDFSVYVDADADLIEDWYLERFKALMKTAFQDPTNYFYPWAIGDPKDAMAMAERVWEEVNLKNLNDYILPTRNRADLILHKVAHHVIDAVYFRKY
ncbi:type I pantothenate kinase [Lactiplantibacillus plantarum]|uniref:type I pantothenate kinase n=1 Tax=Lactiplantibacillus plantarum TaxID=1590 RepID=UPI000D205F30|nr:type I pantothenate kinase [Lactiplantibacillus plantarum]AVV98373.1 type I pantothenate kinase [Lactiplantibacillus plantarum]AVW06922.1 type I pantothenate kinase [Lactiplantibacillus plantarum]MCC9313781.1 type I pantothenate kinase [Lactiplantibacillus plantarum]MDF3263449.1 type I pantothenate kinase [Lactiplantibacillus plantarum]MDO1601906.1 type I pantothenate kinase [Lactiplantibacillus plantarum]